MEKEWKKKKRELRRGLRKMKKERQAEKSMLEKRSIKCGRRRKEKITKNKKRKR